MHCHCGTNNSAPKTHLEIKTKLVAARVRAKQYTRRMNPFVKLITFRIMVFLSKSCVRQWPFKNIPWDKYFHLCKRKRIFVRQIFRNWVIQKVWYSQCCYCNGCCYVYDSGVTSGWGSCIKDDQKHLKSNMLCLKSNIKDVFIYINIEIMQFSQSTCIKQRVLQLKCIIFSVYRYLCIWYRLGFFLMQYKPSESRHLNIAQQQ